MAGHKNSYGKRSHSHSDHPENGGNKRRNSGHEDREHQQSSADPDDAVYRYLCPVKKIGSIIGRGGEIVKQLRLDTKSKIRIGETTAGSEERVVTLYSTREKSNVPEGEVDDGEEGGLICPAQDALYRVHDRVVAEDRGGGGGSDEDDDDEGGGGGQVVTARLLVPSDQIGCVIGKGGQIVQSIRSETNAQVRILKDEHLPTCAMATDELVQISGDPSVVKKALYQIASRLRDNPPRAPQMLISGVPSGYPHGGSLMGPGGSGPIVGIAPMMGHYGGYKGDVGDWSRSLYSAPRDEGSCREFSLRLVCPTGNIGGVIGKGGAIINQIRQESGAAIKVDSSATEGDDCLITVSAKEFFEDSYSPTIEAAVRLQPRCSEKVERDSGLISFTTRILVPASRIGCLIGKGGAIVTEMRRVTKANIRIVSKDNLPKIASDDDEMVQISGELDVIKDALVQVVTRLKANLFDREGALPPMLPVIPYLPVSAEGDGLNYDSRDSKRHGRGHSYGAYGASSDDGYGSYGGSQIGGGGGPYGAYSSGRSSSGTSSQNPSSRRRNYGY